MQASTAGTGAAAPAAGWAVLGAPVQLVITDPLQLESARAMLQPMLAAMDAACSGQRPDSELAGLDCLRRAGPARVSPLLADAIADALRAARLTDGDVDPAVSAADGLPWQDGDALPGPAADPAGPFAPPLPGWRQIRLDPRSRRVWLPTGMRLDLSATVRSWAVDRCAPRLAARLGCGVLVGLGGDIAVAGQAPADGWRIRVQDLSGPPDGPYTVVAIRDGGLSTSSSAARRRRSRADAVRHVLDCRTGLPAAPYWRAVSVAAATCAAASAASAAAMIRGRRAMQWLASLPLPAWLVGLDGRVYTVAGWPARPPASA